MFIRFIPTIMVMIASIITIVVSIFNDFEINFSLKILVIVIILYCIIGNIVKNLVGKILNMDKDMEVTDSSLQEERAEQDDITAEKSGDNDFE